MQKKKTTNAERDKLLIEINSESHANWTILRSNRRKKFN